jgi:ATP-dependent Lon protease
MPCDDWQLAAMAVVQDRSSQDIRVDVDYVKIALGPPKYSSDAALAHAPPGVVTGMAWTTAGGELLFVEAVSIVTPFGDGEEQLTTARRGLGGASITGNIGRVMEESCQIALFWIRANWMKVRSMLGPVHRPVDVAAFRNRVFHSDIRVHMPGGAISKDGPSAGCGEQVFISHLAVIRLTTMPSRVTPVAIVSALLSALMGIAVEPSIAMTGEVTLRGAVLPVGGIREKVLVAARSAIRCNPCSSRPV